MVLNYIVGYNKMQKEQQLFRMYIEIKAAHKSCFMSFYCMSSWDGPSTFPKG